jgi:hypothetical protein
VKAGDVQHPRRRRARRAHGRRADD